MLLKWVVGAKAENINIKETKKTRMINIMIISESVLHIFIFSILVSITDMRICRVPSHPKTI
mgnify:CR=1